MRLRSLADRGEFQAALLHGVTGSGKTEVYLRLAADVRRPGRGVLLLVPEIALTPAVATTFRRTFGERVAIQHSGLSDGERHDQWHRIRRGDVDVVVGTRSAVFAPLAQLGLIVVDEEHDGSYKQEETPRYNGRDVAVVRARQAAARSRSWARRRRRWRATRTPQTRALRPGCAEPPRARPSAARTCRIVDMRAEYAAAGPDVVLSVRPVGRRCGRRLERGEQAIVLLNRRGFATSVFCRQCGGHARLSELQRVADRPPARRSAPAATTATTRSPCREVCAECAGPFLEHARVRHRARRSRGPGRCSRGARRAASTATRSAGAARLRALLAKFAARELDILVGTQMIAKGHDFPRVTLVGVISADVGLGLADFRAAERTFQLLTQVAGRAGRGEIRGEAIVQTLYPNHYSIQHACRQDYAGFLRQELNFRQAMQYPPAVALVNVVVKGKTQQAPTDDAGEHRARRCGPPARAYRVLGPAPAPLEPPEGRAPRPVLHEGTQRSADAHRRCSRCSTAALTSNAGRSSTSIR